MSAKFKIDGEAYESRKADIKTVLDHYGSDPFIKAYKANPVRAIHDLYHQVWFDRRNSSDDHPTYNHRPRLLPHDPDFELYPNDSNDTHIETMVKRALYELLPETKTIDRERKGPSGPGI